MESDVEEKYYLSQQAVKRLESGIGYKESDDEEMTLDEVEDMMRKDCGEWPNPKETQNFPHPSIVDGGGINPTMLASYYKGDRFYLRIGE